MKLQSNFSGFTEQTLARLRMRTAQSDSLQIPFPNMDIL